MDLGPRILAWLAATGMTQQQLAVALSVSPGAVSMWVSATREGRENRTTPRQKHIQKMCSLWGITMGRFYGAVPRRRRVAA